MDFIKAVKLSDAFWGGVDESKGTVEILLVLFWEDGTVCAVKVR